MAPETRGAPGLPLLRPSRPLSFQAPVCVLACGWDSVLVGLAGRPSELGSRHKVIAGPLLKCSFLSSFPTWIQVRSWNLGPRERPLEATACRSHTDDNLRGQNERGLGTQRLSVDARGPGHCPGSRGPR